MKKVFLLIMVVSVSGCATEILNKERNKLSGYPEPYKDGYVQGCSSGTKAAGNPYFSFQKDVNRFLVDPMYAQGWGDGFNVCKADYESIGNAMRR